MSGLFYSIILRFIHDVIVTIVHSFFLLSITPLHGYPKICLSIHLLICFKVFGYCKQSCYEHSSISLCEDIHFFFFFLGLHLRHMEVPRLGVEWELQLLSYPRATAIPDPSCVCGLHCSLQQRWILNPLIGARN